MSTDLVVAGRPLFATERTDRLTAVDEVEKIAELMGFKLMPWQHLLFSVALEYEPDNDFEGGRNYIYREIDFGTPRQSGKSVWSLLKLLHRSITMGRMQQSVYTMQTGSDAARRMLDEWVPMLEESDLAPAVKQTRRSMGSEMIRFRTNSTIEVLRSGKSAGHGRTLDEGHVDEAMHDVDDRREGAILPGMITKPNAQICVYSTAGTDESLFWRRKVDVGRRLVADGSVQDTCYFEWGFPEDADPYDEDVWREFHPAVGHTQGIAAIRHASQTMDEMEFRRAFGNQFTRNSDKIIDWDTWMSCQTASGSISDQMVLAVDINPERSAGAITAASWGDDGAIDLELVDRREGIEWIIPRVVQLRDTHFPHKIVMEGSGPGGAMIPELMRAGVDVTALSGTDIPKACGHFYDRVMARSIRVRPNPVFDDAVAGAAKWKRGDSFVWRRQTTHSDISALMCATLAVWGVGGETQHNGIWVY